MIDIVDEKEKLNNYISENPFRAEKQENWDQIIEFSDMEVRSRLNDSKLLKNPGLR